MMIQIVPALPPATSGVSDYALNLASRMRSEFGVETCFVVGDPGWQGAEQVEGFAARPLASRSAKGLAEVLCAETRSVERPSVMLQLSGYGYSRQGCPYWLLQGLRRWKRQQPDGQLVTMFHELYASAPPWRKTFWFGVAQKMVVKEIVRLSDVAMTTIQLYRKCLERFDPSKTGKVHVLQVSSGVGEPVAPAELSVREKSLIVFGLAGSRQRTYEIRMAALERACQELGIEQVHDVGPDFAGVPQRIGRAPVIRHGRMEGRELSTLLAQAMAGFVDYSSGCMGKSSVFAAYCAHRMVPVVPLDGHSEDDGLRSGVHYYSAGGKAAVDTARRAQAVADAAWEWYQGHSLPGHVCMVARILRGAERQKGGIPLNLSPRSRRS